MQANSQDFEDLVQEAQKNEDILGLILVGSRGKGFESEGSDYDAHLIVKDDNLGSVKAQYETKKFPNIDLSVSSLTSLKNYALPGTPEDCDQYDFAHVKILVDKIGELENICQAKGYLPKDKQKKIIEGNIDAYINGTYRFAKAYQKKRKLGAHLEATTSVMALLSLVFALHGRHRPFSVYLKDELENYPLEKLPWPNQKFLKLISKILKSTDIKSQQEVFSKMEQLCRTEGYGDIYDAWEGRDDLIMKL